MASPRDTGLYAPVRQEDGVIAERDGIVSWTDSPAHPHRFQSSQSPSHSTPPQEVMVSTGRSWQLRLRQRALRRSADFLAEPPHLSSGHSTHPGSRHAERLAGLQTIFLEDPSPFSVGQTRTLSSRPARISPTLAPQGRGGAPVLGFQCTTHLAPVSLWQ